MDKFERNNKQDVFRLSFGTKRCRRLKIFRACKGTELFNAEKENGAINTHKLYGLRFGCTADVVETNFGLTGFKNRFRGFKCVLTDEEKLKLAKEKFGY